MAAKAARQPSPTVPAFGDRSCDQWAVSIMGDLHIDPRAMPLYDAAREQLAKAMAGPDGKPLPGARVVQLGDLGHGKFKSGSVSCFETARQYLDGFQVPRALVLGNHDLEGDEFDVDADNLAAWVRVMGQPHHWAVDLGEALLVGLSTVRYRSNTYSHHEVYIDDSQIEWLESLLVQNANRPVVVFTHAPPIGTGLKVLQSVHIKNRCAYLNHSDRPERFIQLVARHPNIKLWFSGHFHLSHNYPDSISTVGPTAFVQVGVCGEHNRDGFRQSRVLKGDRQGYRLYTLDHDSGQLRLDMAHAWDDLSTPVPQIPEDELVCDATSGWLCSQLDCKMGENNEMVEWFFVGQKTMLALQDEALVEYDIATSSPIGMVCKVVRGCEVRLVTGSGQAPSAADGSDVAAVEVVDRSTGGVDRYPRNEFGCFFKIYQPNKWRLKKEKEAAERAAAVAMGELPAPVAGPAPSARGEGAKAAVPSR